MYGLAEGQALFDDLVELLYAGLLVAVEDGGTVRYALSEETEKTNPPGNR